MSQGRIGDGWRRAGIAVVVLFTLVGVGQRPASAAAAPTIRGSAFGYQLKVTLFGGPVNTRGVGQEACTNPPTNNTPPGCASTPASSSSPSVNLPSSGGNLSQTDPDGTVGKVGPATFISTGQLDVSTQGTPGPPGSVTSSTNIATFNTSHQESFTASNVASTCTASGSGISGSTTVTGGTLDTDSGLDANDNGSYLDPGDHPPVTVVVPTNPAPNTTYSGHIHVNGSQDNFRYVFNEQVTNPDGSFTVNAGHEYLDGPTAVGDLFFGQVVCGVPRTPPTFTAASPPATATVGTAYSYTFAASGDPVPTYSVNSGSLPAGLALDATTGVLSGTPTTPGASTFTVRAANGVSPDAVTGSITVTVRSAPAFTAASPPTTGTVGSPYTYTFAASGSPAPTFSVNSGSLPTGLSLNGTTGVLSGTPVTPGSSTFTVRAANGVSPDAITSPLTINVGTTAPSQITGTVTQAGSGAPLSGICVYLYDTLGARTADPAACTGAQGTYTMAVANAGSYKVAFIDPGSAYVTQWYNSQPTASTANSVTVGAGTTAGINAAMSLAAHAPIPPTVNFDGVGGSDVAVYRPGNGAWFVQGGLTTGWGSAGDVPVPADYDGDGKTDVAVFRPSDQTWYVQGGISTQWGSPGDVPVPGDYNGDGKADIAVFRPSDRTWYVQGGLATQWGINGDVPVPGDYNGDAKTDVAVFRPSDQTWYVQGGLSTQWGANGDVPVTGDFNGDGKTDVAVFRPSDQTWYSQGTGGIATQWGIPGDKAVPADYNGDGKVDVAVFRPSDQTWYVQGGTATQWGVSGDLPVVVPAALRSIYGM